MFFNQQDGSLQGDEFTMLFNSRNENKCHAKVIYVYSYNNFLNEDPTQLAMTQAILTINEVDSNEFYNS